MHTLSPFPTRRDRATPPPLPLTTDRRRCRRAPATACAINAANSTIAVCRCCSPTSSHNTAAGAGLSASSRRSCTIAPRARIIALGQDDTRKQRLQDPPRPQQVLQRRQHPRVRQRRRGLQVTSARMVRTKRSAEACARGARIGVCITSACPRAATRPAGVADGRTGRASRPSACRKGSRARQARHPPRAASWKADTNRSARINLATRYRDAGVPHRLARHFFRIGSSVSRVGSQTLAIDEQRHRRAAGGECCVRRRAGCCRRGRVIGCVCPRQQRDAW